MTQCFLKSLKPSIRAQLDIRGRDLKSWKAAVEKTINAKAKAIFYSSSSTRDMDSRCPQGNRPATKEEKNSSKKNKFTDFAPANISSGKKSSSTQQTFSSHPKKDQNHCRSPRRRKEQSQDSPATGITTTPKKKEGDLSEVDCFHCRKKSYYANRYF